MASLETPSAGRPIADDIATFLPNIGDEEYERRAKLRAMRNAAGAMIATTRSGVARQLAWFASDYATQLVYSPADPQLLDEVAKLCRRLMLTAMMIDRLEPMEPAP
jgi:hypothetical protein